MVMHYSLHNKQLVGIVLAGGQSIRMGQNKALLNYKGKRLIDHMISILKKTKLDHVYVSGKIENTFCILDEEIYKGPGSGIYSVLKHLNQFNNNNTLFLFVPIDMPLLTPNLLQALIESGQNEDAIYYSNQPLPLLIKNKDYVQKILETHINEHAEYPSLKYLLKQINTKEISISKTNQQYFININTPEQWEEIR